MRCCASSWQGRWQRGGQRYQRPPPSAQSGGSLDVSRRKVGRIADAKSCKQHGGVVEPFLASSSSKESRVPPGRTRQSERCPSCVFERLLSLGISTSRWFTASCCRDGSLAVIQPPWVQATAEESSSCGSVRPLACEQRTYAMKIAGKEKEGSCPIACATSHMLVGRDHSVRNDSIYQDRSPRWVGLRGPELVSMGQQALAPAKVWKSGIKSSVSFTLQQKTDQVDSRRFGTQQRLGGGKGGFELPHSPGHVVPGNA